MEPKAIRPIVDNLWRSRYGVLAVQLTGLWIAWQVYRLGRFLVRDQQAVAFINARNVIDLQDTLGLGLERSSQHLMMASETVTRAVNHYYVYGHFLPMVLCLIGLAIWRTDRFRYYRNALLIAMAFGFVVHALFPLAPPRMMRELGMVDTLRVYGPQVYDPDTTSGMANQFAAMPSFHVGWSFFVAFVVISVFRSRWRYLVLAHPLVMTFAVMATANHYLVDGLVGTVLIIAGLQLAPTGPMLPARSSLTDRLAFGRRPH